MSAWDIAGVLVWTPFAASAWWGAINQSRQKENAAATLVLALTTSLAAIFCISRLCGAHA